MASSINPDFITTAPVSKSEMKAQLTVARDEITALQEGLAAAEAAINDLDDIVTGGGTGGIQTALGFVCSDETTSLIPTTGAASCRAPYNLTVNSVRASLARASNSGVVEVDVNKNGVSIFSTRLTIDATEKTSLTAATAAVLSTTSISDDDEITIDIDASGTNAAGLKVWLLVGRLI
jgi:hypothetical protein